MLARPKLVGCAIIFLYIIYSLTACNHKKGDVVLSDIDTLDYTSLTTGVRTLISDSGITKYKLNAAKWYVFEQPEDLWYFPEGLYIEQFDTLFNIQASIQADTAYYHRSKQLWELKGNVKVLNREGQRFFGNSLYWDEQIQEVYSHEHIMIERSTGQLIESDFGFKSNQDMTRYELYSSHGHIDVEDQPVVMSDSTTVVTDSTLIQRKDTSKSTVGIPSEKNKKRGDSIQVKNKVDQVELKKKRPKPLKQHYNLPDTILSR